MFEVKWILKKTGIAMTPKTTARNSSFFAPVEAFLNLVYPLIPGSSKSAAIHQVLRRHLQESRKLDRCISENMFKTLEEHREAHREQELRHRILSHFFRKRAFQTPLN